VDIVFLKNAEKLLCYSLLLVIKRKQYQLGVT